jgi:tRNA A-37 threonylcarbamoyl transferase component Bud32
VSTPTVDIEDAESLVAYLRRADRIDADETPHVRLLVGGVSNKTVLVERISGESWVLKQALSKLRVAADWFSDPARISREAEGLRWLPKFTPPGTITPLVFEDREENLLAMQAVPHPHENWKAMLLAGRVEPGHVDQFARMLGSIHRRSAEADRGDVSVAFADRSFFESLRLEPYYTYTASQIPAAGEFLKELVTQTRARTLCLVHGDFSPKNVLVRDGRLILLDHEVIHWGDPAFDVGFALTHLLSKAHHLRQFRSAFLSAADQFCNAYAEALGPTYWTDEMQIMSGRHLLGCMLGRVAGRSPLEYLTDNQRRRQREMTVRGMRSPPRLPLRQLIQFVYGLGLFDADN